MRFAISFMNQMRGRNASTKTCSTGPRARADGAGFAIEMFLGAISPSTMWK